MNNQLSEKIFEAIDTIVEQRLSQVKFDETIQCTVVGIVPNKTNVYEVKNNSTIYRAIAKEGDIYKADDIVYVSIPQGDYSSKNKIIIGKYLSSSEEVAVDCIDPFSQLIIDKTFILLQEQQETQKIDLGTKKQPTFKQIALTIEDNVQTTLPKYDYMGLELGLETYFSGDEQKRPESIHGNWAIELKLFNENGQLISSAIVDADTKETISSYVLSSSEIQGNPYSLTPTFKQRRLYTLAEGIAPHDINKAELWLYQQDNFDTDGQLVVHDVKLVFGFDTQKFLDNPVHLYIEGNYNGVFDYSNNMINGTMSAPDIKALIIDQETKQLISTLPDNQVLRWYQYVIGDPGDKIGGAYWQLIQNVKPGKEEINERDLTLYGQNYTLQAKRPTSKIKAVLCEYTANTNLDTNKIKDLTVIDIRTTAETDKWENNENDRTQILCVATDDPDTFSFYSYQDSEGFSLIKPNDNSSTFLLEDFHRYWLNCQYDPKEQSGLKDYIHAFVHLTNDIEYSSQGVYYYYCTGDQWKKLEKDASPDEIELKPLGTSETFTFTNKLANIVGGTGEVDIITGSGATQFFYYDGTQLISATDPIKLTIQPSATSKTWPGKKEGEEPSSITWEVLSGGAISGIDIQLGTDDENLKQKVAESII